MTDSDLEIILPDDGTILVCPKCYTNNPEGSNFCLNCGFSLRKPSSRKTKWIWLLALLIVSLAAMFYNRARLSDMRPTKSVSKPLPSATIVPHQESTKPKALPPEPPPPKNEEVSQAASSIKFPSGVVVIKDITGRIISEVPVSIVGGGWVALPKQACLGGAEWTLRIEPDTEVSIVGGIYNDYDKVGLWRILEDLTIDGPELFPWSPADPLVWSPLNSENSPEPVELENTREQGYFIEALLPEDFRESGILFQQNRAVGWTFGDPAVGGFVWNGDEGKYLKPEIRVDDFYRITFANSREEEFTKALAMEADYSSIERIEAFANGFKFETKLSANETPAHLRDAEIIENIRTLIADALQSGAARSVANIFDVSMLVEAADIGLLMDVAQSNAIGYGFAEAVNLAENVASGLPSLSEK
ncbi:MAG: zinc ribbon domain-containing protein, partial [Desulfobacterales bacterium]